jgi:hypothetical protein
MSELIRSSKPHEDCHATKEALMQAGKVVLEDCPICSNFGVLCRVACHRSSGTQSWSLNPVDWLRSNISDNGNISTSKYVCYTT